MKNISLQKGFSLIELMIAVAIIAIIAAVGMPAYNGYITTSREGVLVNNLSTIEVFQEDFRLRNGNFLVAAANLAAITAGIGWQPQDDGGVTYVITDPGGGSYDITATDAGGTTVCMTMPEKVRC